MGLLRLGDLVSGSAAAVGFVLGETLQISTRANPGCAGPCSDGRRIWLPLGWLRRRKIRDRATIVAIIAHEAGHLGCCSLDNVPELADLHAAELRSDWIAGYVLGRLGLSAQGFALLLRRLPRGASHPLGWVRSEVTLSGWTVGHADRTRRETPEFLA